ncbi:hypothetical protein [Portibacter lacus]|uniref:Uncharacterized protein n=1 Tax=Portibacter lacus TaxID=1099794 RepID=A0AA37SQF9_9BACT|nr:hypothetical protein [Portibacter lacus]GLR16713.1 hypothetical protein GCM10007940_13280 [Portibacter lacus]
MAQHTRSELYKIYKGGFHDKAFEHLVDSALNIKDDGLGINPEQGLVLTAKGPSKKLASFYQRISDKSTPLWSISLDNERGGKGLNFLEGDTSRLFIKEGGRVGINTENPNYQLDVNGLIAVKGIVGAYASGKALADSKWHTMAKMTNLDGCQAYEIIAHIVDEKDKRFGLTIGTVLMTYGKRGYKTKVISVESANRWLFGRFWNKIKFRWIIDDLNTEPGKLKYMCQIKTKGHYGMKDGQPKEIFYRIKRIWDMDYELEAYPKTNWEETKIARPVSSSGNVSGRQEAVPVKRSGGIAIKRK